MQATVPDLNWYLGKSKVYGVPPRCSFATADRCPRFYQSLSLLGNAGSTSIEPEEDERLQKKWSNSDLWPLTGEQATGIAGPSGDIKHFTNFCPEVSFDSFGCFASNLHRYADEIDSGVANRRLEKEGASRGDWRWAWSHVSHTHYTECPLYSLLLQDYPKGTSGSHDKQPETNRKAGSDSESLPPKPPEIMQKIKWIHIHGPKHWKIAMIALACILVFFVIKSYVDKNPQVKTTEPIPTQQQKDIPPGGSEKDRQISPETKLPPDSVSISFTFGISFKDAVKMIAANDSHTAVFSNCLETLLNVKVEPGKFSGKTPKELIDVLRYRLVGSGAVPKYRVEHFKERGIYEILCR